MSALTTIEPVNKTPILLCEGECGEDDHRPHTFIRRQRRTSESGESYMSTTIEDIFACDTCGTERVYGCSDY